MRTTLLRRGMAIWLMLLTATACGASGSVRLNASPRPSRVLPTASRPPVVTSAFSGLTLAHPAAWRQYSLSPGDSLDPQAAGYLTNEPIPAACHGPGPRTVVCGQPVTALGGGGVYITVQVLYQPPMPLQQANRTIGGYPADVVTGPDPGTDGCPAATTYTIAATLSRADVQPSEVLIFACLGGPDTRQAQQVVSMLTSARIATRPAATEPVPGAARCGGRDLAIEPGPRLSSMTQERGLIYAVRNTGHDTCRVSGYPAVRLFAGMTRLPFAYHDGGGPYLVPGRPPALYLRPGMYASFQIDTSACAAAAGTAVTTAEVTLPGQAATSSLPAATRTGPGPLGYCEQPGQAIYVSALNAY